MCQRQGGNDFIAAHEKSAGKKLVGNLTHLTNTTSMTPKHAHIQPSISPLPSIKKKKEEARRAKMKEKDRGKKSSRGNPKKETCI